MMNVHDQSFGPVKETPQIVQNKVSQTNGDDDQVERVALQSGVRERPGPEHEAGEISERSDERGVSHRHQTNRPLWAFVRLMAPVGYVN